jgi:hypothetical protein
LSAINNENIEPKKNIEPVEGESLSNSRHKGDVLVLDIADLLENATADRVANLLSRRLQRRVCIINIFRADNLGGK